MRALYAVFTLPRMPEQFSAFSVQLSAGRINSINTDLTALLQRARDEGDVDLLNDFLASLSHTIHHFNFKK